MKQLRFLLKLSVMSVATLAVTMFTGVDCVYASADEDSKSAGNINISNIDLTTGFGKIVSNAFEENIKAVAEGAEGVGKDDKDGDKVEYWAKTEKFSSSIENLKKLFTFVWNYGKGLINEAIYEKVVKRFETGIENALAKANMNDEHGKNDESITRVLGLVNGLVVLETLHKTLLEAVSSCDIAYIIWEDESVRNALFEEVWSKVCGRGEWANRLLKYFDSNNNMSLRDFVEHDWKCYLTQFFVICNGIDKKGSIVSAVVTKVAEKIAESGNKDIISDIERGKKENLGKSDIKNKNNKDIKVDFGGNNKNIKGVGAVENNEIKNDTVLKKIDTKKILTKANKNASSENLINNYKNDEKVYDNQNQKNLTYTKSTKHEGGLPDPKVAAQKNELCNYFESVCQSLNKVRNEFSEVAPIDLDNSDDLGVDKLMSFIDKDTKSSELMELYDVLEKDKISPEQFAKDYYFAVKWVALTDDKDSQFLDRIRMIVDIECNKCIFTDARYFEHITVSEGKPGETKRGYKRRVERERAGKLLAVKLSSVTACSGANNGHQRKEVSLSVSSNKESGSRSHGIEDKIKTKYDEKIEECAKKARVVGAWIEDEAESKTENKKFKKVFEYINKLKEIYGGSVPYKALYRAFDILENSEEPEALCDITDYSVSFVNYQVTSSSISREAGKGLVANTFPGFIAEIYERCARNVDVARELLRNLYERKKDELKKSDCRLTEENINDYRTHWVDYYDKSDQIIDNLLKKVKNDKVTKLVYDTKQYRDVLLSVIRSYGKYYESLNYKDYDEKCAQKYTDDEELRLKWYEVCFFCSQEGLSAEDFECYLCAILAATSIEEEKMDDYWDKIFKYLIEDMHEFRFGSYESDSKADLKRKLRIRALKSYVSVKRAEPKQNISFILPKSKDKLLEYFNTEGAKAFEEKCCSKVNSEVNETILLLERLMELCGENVTLEFMTECGNVMNELHSTDFFWKSNLDAYCKFAALLKSHKTKPIGRNIGELLKFVMKFVDKGKGKYNDDEAKKVMSDLINQHSNEIKYISDLYKYVN